MDEAKARLQVCDGDERAAAQEQVDEATLRVCAAADEWKRQGGSLHQVAG